MNKWTVAIVVAGSLVWGQAALAAPIQTHCANDEVTLFACPIKKKVVSYCAGPQRPPYTYIEYRYGVPGKVEKTYRADGTANNMFVSSVPLGPKESVHSIWFQEGAVTTDLLHCGGGNCQLSTPGLVVMNGTKLLAKLMCSGDVKGDIWDFPVKEGDNGGLAPDNTTLLKAKENASEPENILMNAKIK